MTMRAFAFVWLFALLAAPAAADDSAWYVTIAVHVDEAGGKPVELHVAVPADDPRQTISEIEVKARGLTSDVIDGAEPEVVFRGRVEDSKRVAVSFRVDRVPWSTALPPIDPVVDPPREALEALRPASLYPARSILVREFLEENVAPRLAGEDVDVLRAIYDVIREELPYDRKGKSLPLDVLRRGHGLRIGRERVFTACLRSAGIPARFVEGIALSSSTKRKRRFWNEVWAEGTWHPVSLSGGWRGKIPSDYVAVAADGRRVVRSLGAGVFTYHVVVRPAPPRSAQATPSPAAAAAPMP